MPESVLLIDVGNSRVKWGVHDGTAWTARDAIAIDRIDELSQVWARHNITRALGVCVAGNEVRQRIETALRGVRIHWITSQASQAGVVNRYNNPQRLGADRWAALIGARQRGGAWIVVNAGTAVTIDALSTKGEFLGGLILPGLQMMFDALVKRTAGLKVAPGVYDAFPRDTANAMTTGAIDAAVGAVQRLHERLSERDGEVKVLLSGGAAQWLAPHIRQTMERTENVVLDGLVAIAKDTAK